MLLQNFQFPWRFLIITVFTTAILGSLLIDKIPQKYKLPAIIVIIALIIFFNKDYWHAKRFVKRSDNYFAGVQQAPADTGETSPIWSIRFMEHGYKNPLEVIDGSAIIQKEKRTTTEHLYNVIVQTRSRFLENTLYFPGWEVLANGTSVPLEFQDQRYRGLMTFYLEPGKYNVDVKFRETKFRWLSDVISVVSLSMIFVYLLLKIPVRYGNINEKNK